jgi:hypothetical protein
MLRRRKESRWEATPETRQHLCRIHRNEHAERTTSCRMSSMRLIPVDLIHPRRRLRVRIDVVPAKTRNERMTSQWPRPPATRTQRSDSAAPPLYTWELCIVTWKPNFSRVHLTLVTQTCRSRRVPSWPFLDLKNLDLGIDSPPRRCPAAESSFSLRHRDAKLTGKPSGSGGGWLRLVDDV